ncbi:DUF1365 family protein [Rhynchospora pubera]|uniref:DUF1365 family protein n=1 Tax=Rhynchospora pubera TaxID=906938 RepID=A0AAV8H6J2_9POAL|nr:DUF1365 family protein [Rhynchospora pubera]
MTLILNLQMEALYLLFSIASTTLTSSFLSLSLFLRSLFSRVFPHYSRTSPAYDEPGPPPVRVYEGRVRHVRKRPVLHEFEYPVRYALIDLDRTPHCSDLSADAARRVAGTNGPVYFLTIPKSVGYEQNPLSIYYCYNIEQGKAHLNKCIAEVTNTPWGERVQFVFLPGSDLVAKPLHVSPFMDMLGNWRIKAVEPSEKLSVVISVHHPTHGDYFTAILHAQAINSVKSLLSMENYFWLMPHKVAIWIYWQALRLWMKNVKFLDHPKFLCPKYRDEALIRNQNLMEKRNTVILECDGEKSPRHNEKQRWCVWTDAKWPWS